MKIGILGCGLIGEKRGLQTHGHTVVGVFDPDRARSAKLSQLLKCTAFESSHDLISKSGADIIIVATTNNQLAPMSMEAIKQKKNVLVEKPGAVSLKELDEMIAASKKFNVAVKVGFNHRFHPALLKAKELVDAGALGELMFLRARYGHGGRVGYEKEWRSIPEMSGGGELLDQGVHLLDLIHSFFGPLPLASSFVATTFWNMKVDDNAVLTLGDEKRWATFHVSCSEWKNTFSCEIYGRTGKILIQGLGRSYGAETLTYYKMLPEMGPPKIQEFNFPSEDFSWGLDLENLVDHLEKKTPLIGDLVSARYALEQVKAAYRANGYTELPCSV